MWNPLNPSMIALLTSSHIFSTALASGLSPDVKALVAVWLFAVGGAVGSFLNVVAYRLPLGLSLSLPGSHCPACKHAIRWYDNVPILGWIFLRGRCRDCRAWISPRYPIVEGITAGGFLTLGAVEGLSGGANLPLVVNPAQSAAVAAYHLLLVSTLLAAALIELDGHRVPKRLMVPALVIGWSAPLAWSYLHPVPAWPALGSVAAAGANATAGLACGLVLGLAVRQVIGASREFGFPLALGCAGLFLGWQAASVLAVVCLAAHVVHRILPRPWGRPRPNLPTTWLALGTPVWILAWKPLVSLWPF